MRPLAGTAGRGADGGVVSGGVGVIVGVDVNVAEGGKDVVVFVAVGDGVLVDVSAGVDVSRVKVTVSVSGDPISVIVGIGVAVKSSSVDGLTPKKIRAESISLA